MIGALWAFSGIDGSGKTTQSELFVRHLAERGCRTWRVWVRIGYSPFFHLLKGLVRSHLPQVLPRPGRSAERARRFSSRRVRRLWLILAMLDLFVYAGLWTRVLLLAGFEVVADRWVEDSEIDLGLNFPEDGAHRWRLWRLVRHASPRPRLHFLITIPVAESLRRLQQKSEPFPDDAATLTRRVDMYGTWPDSDRLVRLRGLSGRDELHASILSACDRR